MDKRVALISALVVVIVAVSVFAVIFYNKNNNLNEENQALNSRIGELTSEKALVISEKEQCLQETGKLQDQMNMLQDDVSKIYKTCPTNNACRGHFPGISWKCNNVGDAVSDPSHTCICDVECNLNATQLQN